MNVPHDLQAEQAVLGACLMGRTGQVIDQLTPSDFYGPLNAHLFAILTELHNEGTAPDHVIVRDRLAKITGEADNAARLIIDTMSAGTGSASKVARIVVRHATARRVITAARAITELADQNLEPDELLDSARAELAVIESPIVNIDRLRGLSTLDDFLDHSDAEPSPWVIPGLLREGWRAMVVAGEGLGKTVCTSQIAVCAAQGIHPFAHTLMPAVRTLIVDLENPEDAITATCRPITTKARAKSAAYEPGRAWIWHQPGGINVRTRTDRANLEAVIAATQPDLVCLGPIYKVFEVAARESDEVACRELQHVLDDLRTRYSFALMLEHHAPKRSGVSDRDLVPYGSSLWLRWPELGLKLVGGVDGSPEGSLTVGRWRHDRMRNSWPDRLDRGGPGGWPWDGYWANGMGEF